MNVKPADIFKLYIGHEFVIDDKERGVLMGGDFVPNYIGQVYYNLQTEEMKDDEVIIPYNDDYESMEPRIKPILRSIETLTDDECMEAFEVIGGTPHLSVIAGGIKDALIDGDFEGYQMDYFTMGCLMLFLRKIGIDCDDLIQSGLAVDKSQVNITK